MKESYGEGVAIRTGPESCAVGREPVGEALTGVRAGRVSSREKHAPWRQPRELRGADAVEGGGRPYPRRRQREAPWDPARERSAGPRCPTCDRPVSWPGNPARPFCSLNCKLIDLGAWLDEAFRVPGPPLPLPDLPVATASSELAAELETGRS